MKYSTNYSHLNLWDTVSPGCERVSKYFQKGCCKDSSSGATITQKLEGAGRTNQNGMDLSCQQRKAIEHYFSCLQKDQNLEKATLLILIKLILFSLQCLINEGVQQSCEV